MYCGKIKIEIFVIILLIINISPALSQLKNRFYDNSECGLRIIHKSTRITGRAKNHAPNPQPVLFTINEFPDSCFEFRKAYAWWSVSYREGTEPESEITVNGGAGSSNKFSADLIGEEVDKCWTKLGELGTRSYRADISDAITGNGTYSFQVSTTDWETDGISILIIYRDLTADFEGHLILQDGIITRTGEMVWDTSQTISGFEACDNSIYAKGFAVISDLQKRISKYQNLIINGIDERIEVNFWNSELIETQLLEYQNSFSIKTDFGSETTEQDCYSWIAMGLYYRTDSCGICPEQPDVSIDTYKDTICKGEIISLEANGADKYQWRDESGKKISSFGQLTVSPTKTSKYYLKGYDPGLCSVGYDSINIVVRETRSKFKYEMAEVCAGFRDDFICVLTNTTEWTQEIGSIRISNNASAFQLKENYNFPIKLKGGDSLVFPVEFSPNKEGIHSDSIAINIISPCDSVVKFEIRGSSVYSGSEVRLPDTSGLIGTEKFTVRLTNTINCNDGFQRIMKYNTEIHLDPTVYHIENVYGADLISKEIENNVQKLSLSGKLPLINGKTIPLARFEGFLYTNNDSVTALEIVDFTWENSDIEVKKINGRVKAIGICGQSISQLEYLEPVEYTLLQNPVDEELKITVTSGDKGNYTMNLYNLHGKSITGRVFYKPEKELPFEVSINTQNLPSGVYSLVLKSYFGVKVKQIIVIH